jgi:hypothetical protein
VPEAQHSRTLIPNDLRAALKHELGAEELIYGPVATLVAAPHSVGGKIHATCHWRVVGFDDLNVFERPKASQPSERFAASYWTVLW